MKALSFKQPWAWAVFNGKDVDNRPWKTKFRGRIYVHASKNFDMAGWKWIAENENRLGLVLPWYADRDFIRGAIIGEVTITDCVVGEHAHGSRWYFGPNGLVLADAKLYDEPIFCRGMLGLFEPNIERGKHGT